ncbi:MAG: helix-hairpin-helix domain-containing protein [Fulvivirga sp.]|nr:helix-hairpin-helix domain-containing protein [Fulvivirga sp.]
MTKTLTILLLTFLIACQQQAKEENTAEESKGQNETPALEEESQRTVINPNLATEEELVDTGLSQAMVDRILKDRPFLDMMDLHGLLSQEKDSTSLALLYGKLFVPFNINTTAEDNFKLIPGVGDRMAHEFEEYRPYTKIQQFRKEIGKYVDEEEVARLEQYIFVPVELNSASEEDILALPGVGKRMAHEFEEYRPYKNMEQFRKEIGKYVDEKELSRLERFVYLEKE